MSDFSITFVPPLESKRADVIPSSLSELNVPLINAAYTVEHRIEYKANGEIFTYYPASILTVLNDIDLELRLIQERENHPTTLSGYTVLHMKFQDDVAQLSDPVTRDGNGHEKIVGNFAATELEAEFQNAMSLVWGLIQSLESQIG